MAWVKIDDSFLSHPKVLAAGKDGRALIIAGLCYSAANLTDGLIVDAALPMLAGAADVKSKPAAAQLVELGIWHRENHECERCDPVPSGHYLIHDFLDYQETGAEVSQRRREISERRAEAGRKGAAARWGDGKRNGKPHGKAMANGSQSDAKRGDKPMTPSPSPDCFKQNPSKTSADARRISGRTADPDNGLDSPDGSPDDRAIRAIDWLAWQRTDAAKGVRSRERYHAGVLDDLRVEHWPRALANARRGWTPRDIAGAIENPSYVPQRRTGAA